jgi:hypothetical protein
MREKAARHVRQRHLFFTSKANKSRKVLKNWLQQLLVENMSSTKDQEIEELSQKIMSEIEHTSSKDLAESEEMTKILHLANVHHVKTLFQQMDEAKTRSERDVGKKAVIKALLVSTYHQRLYFIIRSAIMGLISASITFGFIVVFGSIDFTLEIGLGVFSFVLSLTVSRLFDFQIVKITQNILLFMGDHKGLRDFVLKHF